MNENGPRIYVRCLAAYNNGILHGEWINANQPAEDIEAEVTAMLAKSPIPLAEEWAIHDFEGFEGWKLEEWTSFAAVSAVASLIESHGEAFAAWLDHTGMDVTKHDTDELRELFEEQYRGKYESEKAFAMEVGDEYGENWVVTALGAFEVPEKVTYYLDWDAIARDLFIDCYWSAQASDYRVHVFDVV